MWCDGGYGRRAEVARLVNTSRYSVTHWLGGRQFPTVEQALTIQEFLKKQRVKLPKNSADAKPCKSKI
jgi:hypothetical protein